MFVSKAEITQLHTIKINTENLFKITQSTDMLSLNNIVRFFFILTSIKWLAMFSVENDAGLGESHWVGTEGLHWEVEFLTVSRKKFKHMPDIETKKIVY